MPYVSILAAPGDPNLHIEVSPEPLGIRQPHDAEGRFVDRPQILVFQREVPDPVPLLVRVEAALASSRVKGAAYTYSCPAPIAIRAVEIAVAELWTPNRVRCSDCNEYFVAPIADARRMYVACPHCHNPMLNPRWHSA